MISVSKIYQTIRQEGPNCGLPATFVHLGFGADYVRADELILDILKVTELPGHTYLFGEEPTKLGIGAVIKGLERLNVKTELQLTSSDTLPSWWKETSLLNVYMNYQTGKTNINLEELRPQDAVKIVITAVEDVLTVQDGLEALVECRASKYLCTPLSAGKELYRECIHLLRRFPGVRCYQC